MCGLVGRVSTSSRSANDHENFDLSLIRHRGPDSFGSWLSSDKRVFFGHTRLSIIDISGLGHQPMCLENLKLTLVFNGEIYNYMELRTELKSLGYTFKTGSDTEVLMIAYSAWGVDFTKRLNGMFAFAIYDENNKKVILGRDRSGQKPLFYFYKNRQIYFCSELKALSSIPELPRKVNLGALDQYLAMGFVAGTSCILEGFKKLEAASVMIFDTESGSLKKKLYWTPPSNQRLFDRSASLNSRAHLEKLLEDSVKRHLVADVPVGVLLSGGLDSSLITAFASRHFEKIKTFNVSIPNNSKYDEAQHAREIAKYFNTEHFELEATDQLTNLLPKLAWHFDEPISDSSIIPMALVSEAVSKNCKVALGGDGSDELFGGYDHYQKLLKLYDLSKFAPKKVRAFIANYAEQKLPLGFKNSNLRTWLMAFGADLKHELPMVANLFDVFSRRQLLAKYKNDIIFEDDRVPLLNSKHGDLISFAMLFDFQKYLIDDLLVKVDRASMMHSLEVRAPFLDTKLIDFAFSNVLSNEKVDKTNKKVLLKKVARKILPHSYDFDRKQGFSIPLSDWLVDGPFKNMAYDILLSNNCTFNKQTVLKLLDGQRKNRNNSERIFSLLNFELWKQTHKIAI